LRKNPIVGTITGVFDGALDGVQARLIGRTKLGYTVELLASRETFHKGDRVHLSGTEFIINKGELNHKTAMTSLPNSTEETSS